MVQTVVQVVVVLLLPLRPSQLDDVHEAADAN